MNLRPELQYINIILLRLLWFLRIKEMFALRHELLIWNRHLKLRMFGMKTATEIIVMSESCAMKNPEVASLVKGF